MICFCGIVKPLKEVAGVFICRPTPAVMPTLRLLQQDRGKGMTAVFGYEMKEILLTQGKVAIVDDEYFCEFSHYNWCFSTLGYAIRAWPGSHGRNMWMHREIMQPPDGIQIDHINGNKLDNRVSNLRLATASQNHCNRPKSSRNTSGYKGVGKRNGRWRVKIRLNGIDYHVGYFSSLEEAAQAYDVRAKELHGEFARINHND